MAAADGEPIDPDDTGLLALDVPADSDLPRYTKTVDVLRDVTGMAAEYAADRDVDGPMLRYGEADGRRVDLGVVPAREARYVADRVQDALAMHGYEDEVDVVYERMDGGGVLHPDTRLPDDAVTVDLTEDPESQDWLDDRPDREPFSEWSDEKAARKAREAEERLDELRDE